MAAGGYGSGKPEKTGQTGRYQVDPPRRLTMLLPAFRQ